MRNPKFINSRTLLKGTDTARRDDGTIIAVGNSAFRGGGTIAGRWNNLSIEDLHFPS